MRFDSYSVGVKKKGSKTKRSHLELKNNECSM